ncbi:MAG: hypothetical protein HGA45_19330, partial [Chloroflexales bacterium]|nr:hypothetical protein [Chloroflexales bacterium]
MTHADHETTTPASPLSRRAFLRLSATFGAGAVLAACGAAQSATVPTTAATTGATTTTAA